MEFVFFFFKRKTAYEIEECDWSSDVCSSDLPRPVPRPPPTTPKHMPTMIRPASRHLPTSTRPTGKEPRANPNPIQGAHTMTTSKKIAYAKVDAIHDAAIARAEDEIGRAHG